MTSTRTPSAPDAFLKSRLNPYKTPITLTDAIVISAVLGLIVLYITSDREKISLDVAYKYFLSAPILSGLGVTIGITIISAITGLIGGVLIALMRSSKSVTLRALSSLYITIFRSIPLLVQILVWYNLATFFPSLSIGIPFSSIGLVVDTNAVISPMMACFLAMGLHQAAYTAEIVRSGLSSVPTGQIEAGIALGMTKWLVFRRVLAPHAFRVMIPPLGNDVISLLKASSLVSVIGVGDLMTRAQTIYAANFQVIPLLFVVSVWYLIITIAVQYLQRHIERFLQIEGKSVRRKNDAALGIPPAINTLVVSEYQLHAPKPEGA